MRVRSGVLAALQMGESWCLGDTRANSGYTFSAVAGRKWLLVLGLGLVRWWRLARVRCFLSAFSADERRPRGRHGVVRLSVLGGTFSIFGGRLSVLGSGLAAGSPWRGHRGLTAAVVGLTAIGIMETMVLDRAIVEGEVAQSQVVCAERKLV